MDSKCFLYFFLNKKSTKNLGFYIRIPPTFTASFLDEITRYKKCCRSNFIIFISPVFWKRNFYRNNCNLTEGRSHVVSNSSSVSIDKISWKHLRCNNFYIFVKFSFKINSLSIHFFMVELCEIGRLISGWTAT